MPQNYVESRVKAALKKTNGNRTLARQQIIAWAAEDHELLVGLTRAHLSGIVAYNIDRVASGRSARVVKESTQPSKKASSAGQSTNIDADFGAEILKAVAGNAGAMFGFENNGPRPAKAGVSQDHINALKAMSAKNRGQS